MKMLSEGNFSNVNKSIADLKDKQGILENGTSEKYKNLKKQIIDLEDRFANYLKNFVIIY